MTKISSKAGVLRLPENSTPEELESSFQYAKFLHFGKYLLMAGYRYGYYGAVYEFKTGNRSCEDEIRLVEVSDGFFADDGHAMKWAMTVRG
ncbi:MAG: hypothetical protein IJQ77_08890 [Synergistaceae bacterium]|nr:hypothetical protein [Synergistaceae bacterium]MBQ6111321.1 hypothetical protein [Synergistaceae bacterium]MBR0251185.1 hypothetical protein [Synergistaceae bacterium]